MEWLDIYDDYGNLTGRKIIRGDRSAKLSNHEHIAVANIFIENSKGEFLIQKTSKEKGGLFSTTGGHVDSGETPYTTIVREVKEEIGIDISKEKIIDYGFLLYDMPLRYLFYLKKDINIKDVDVQKEEVDYVKYMSVSDIRKLIDEKQMLESHGIMFNELIRRINK